MSTPEHCSSFANTCGLGLCFPSLPKASARVRLSNCKEVQGQLVSVAERSEEGATGAQPLPDVGGPPGACRKACLPAPAPLAPLRQVPRYTREVGLASPCRVVGKGSSFVGPTECPPRG